MADADAAPRLVIDHVKVSDEYARDILTTAVEQGIGYWAEVVGVTRLHPQGGEVIAVRVRDLEADLPNPTANRPVRAVTAGGIKRAVALVLREGDAIGAGGEIRRQVLNEAVDAPRADAVFQVALFGEVRYS